LQFGKGTGVTEEWSKIVVIGGNVGIGTGVFGTSAQRVLGIGNGTAPSSSPADMVQLWAEDISASSELRVRDEAGNVTTLSPHPTEFLNKQPSTIPFPWAYHSKNEYLGKEIYVDLALLAMEVERLSGKKIIHLTDVPKKSWNENQEAMKRQREDEIANTQKQIDDLDAELLEEKDEEVKAQLMENRKMIIVPEPYVKKSPPEWMKLRGVEL